MIATGQETSARFAVKIVSRDYPFFHIRDLVVTVGKYTVLTTVWNQEGRDLAVRVLREMLGDSDDADYLVRTLLTTPVR